MKFFEKLLFAASLCFLLSPAAYALTSGSWGATVSCGPREDISPVRPGFSRPIPSLTIKNEAAALSHTYKEFGKVDVNENWKIKSSKNSLTVSGDATRSTNGEQWQYSFAGNSSSGNSFELNGTMISSDQKKIRDCKFALTLITADAQPTERVMSNVAAVDPNNSAAKKLVVTEPTVAMPQVMAASKQSNVALAKAPATTPENPTLKEELAKTDLAIDKQEEKITPQTNTEPITEATVVRAEEAPKVVAKSNIYFWFFENFDNIVLVLIFFAVLIFGVFMYKKFKNKPTATDPVVTQTSREIEELKRQLEAEKEKSSKISQELNSLHTAGTTSSSISLEAKSVLDSSSGKEDASSAKSLKSQLEEKIASANLAGNLNKGKSFVFSVLDWCAIKWAPIKAKVLSSKFGIKYPRFAKLISNGWVVLFLVASLGGGGRHSDRDSDSSDFSDDPRANSSDCRWATQTAKEICSSLKYDSSQYMRCLRDQINARGTCPRI